ncbi:unnamed protein product [Somion occarium]|uniref:Uncharacterized protein n=1 Tax=Somion occarium TaxID=3059160 RepID=A0ABP1E8H1_9APHY
MSDDELFIERLQILYDKQLSDLQTFASRESRPYDEVRRLFSEWHCKYLYNNTLSAEDRRSKSNEVLRRISTTLEALEKTAGLQSFFLVVNPQDPDDDGFLGGTLLGREFWRNHRGCGSAGAQAFKAHCSRTTEVQAGPSQIAQQTPYAPPPIQGASGSAQRSPANVVKADVYSAVRNAIRAISGQRNAEMKWSNHSKLSTYGIRIEGWPAHIPHQNPSSLSASQNRQILNALTNGTLRFVRLATLHTPEPGPESGAMLPITANLDAPDDFSWAYNVTPSTDAEMKQCGTIDPASIHVNPPRNNMGDDVHLAQVEKRHLHDNSAPNG